MLFDPSSLGSYCVIAFSLRDGSPPSMALQDTASFTSSGGGRPGEGWPKCRLRNVAVTLLDLLPLFPPLGITSPCSSVFPSPTHPVKSIPGSPGNNPDFHMNAFLPSLPLTAAPNIQSHSTYSGKASLIYS